MGPSVQLSPLGCGLPGPSVVLLRQRPVFSFRIATPADARQDPDRTSHLPLQVPRGPRGAKTPCPPRLQVRPACPAAGGVRAIAMAGGRSLRDGCCQADPAGSPAARRAVGGPGDDRDDRRRIGGLRGSRTPDLLVRSQALYPAELGDHALQDMPGRWCWRSIRGSNP